jgi:arylsulfatase A-like enzyme
MIFVDTLRPDHLSPYGYERDTSPATQRIAEQGVVFEAARSVAPWTLPSARSTLTGRHPEYFETSPTLQGRLRGEGWATAMFAGNLYLGANFDMNKDWGLHHVVLWPSATEQVDGALAWLEEHKGRDSLMLLHFMDAHLPYQEPGDYRRLFAGDPPETLTKEEFHRNHVLKAKLRTPEDRQYVRDRYDNNIRYVDDELNRLYEYLDEDDIIVYFSDHGEEFWDHKGYEHGHTLFDELLRVPLIVRAPSLDAGRVSEPVSLLDVTPTVLDLLDMEADGLDGVSLVAAAQGAEGATEALAKRDLAFGRPLYGSERWGVLHGDEKYTLNEGREALYRIGDDPNERNNIFSKLEEDDPGAEYRPLLGDALGREMVTGYRLWTTWLNRASDDDTVARLTVPGGIAAAFVGSDPTLNSHASVQIDGEVATITWTRGYRGSREVWVVPSEPMENVTTQLTAQIEFGDQRGTIDVPDTKSGTLPKVRVPLGRAQVGGRTVLIGYGIAPSPDDEMNEISGYDDELAEQLKAMGYVFDDE